MNSAIKFLLFLALTPALPAENTEILNLGKNPVTASVTIEGKTRKIEIAPAESSGRFNLAEGKVQIGDLSHQAQEDGENILVFRDGEEPTLTSHEVALPGETPIRLAILNLTPEAIPIQISEVETSAEPEKLTPLGNHKRAPDLTIPGIDERKLPRLNPLEKAGITLLLYKTGEELSLYKITVYGG